MSAVHTSVPRDSGLRPDPSATAHLVVAETHGASTQRLVDELRVLAAPIEILAGGSEDDLMGALSASRVGLRLYVSGSEQFVRRMVACASRAGLIESEVLTEIVGSRSRRVICIHCKSITTEVTTSIAECAGCGASLLVYHHFSRRHVAYMGFCADAEVPGELPEAESLWP